MEAYYVEKVNTRMKETGMEFFLQILTPGAVGTNSHIHESIEILWFRSGRFRVSINETEYHVKKDDILLFRSNAIHKVYAEKEEEETYYVLKVKPSFFLELASEQNAIGYLLRFVLPDKDGKTCWYAEDERGAAVREALKLLLREYEEDSLCKDISLKLCAGQVLLCLLRDMMRDEKERGVQGPTNDNAAAQIYSVIRFINENYGSDIDAGQCGEMVHMSYSYFSHCFKNVTGRSFKSYLNEVRINHAEKLLATTDLSVTQVAAECGYNSVSYFISVYKSLKGKTPLLERK